MEKIGHWIYQDFEEVESTNDVAKSLFKKVNQKCIVSAKKQTKGRGRLGRQWESHLGNLFVSFAFFIEDQKIGHYVILSALAVMKTIQFFAPSFKVEVKWPNDVLLENKKISGILFEKSDDGCWIMGIGMNIAVTPQIENPIYQTTSLADCHIPVNRLEALQKLVENFDGLEEIYHQRGFEPMRKLWLDNAFCRDKTVCIKNNQNCVEGVLKDLDSTGALLIKNSKGIEKIIAGDLYGSKNN